MKEKVCCYCHKNKPFKQFSIKRHGKSFIPQSYCKECALWKAKAHYQKHKAEFKTRSIQYLAAFRHAVNLVKEKYGCANCNLKDYRCLDFHHIDPSNKLEGVGELTRMKSKTKTLEEINKCVVLCANCHRLIHYGVISVSESKLCNEESLDSYIVEGKIKEGLPLITKRTRRKD